MHKKEEERVGEEERKREMEGGKLYDTVQMVHPPLVTHGCSHC